ncbi:hypothetical protein JYU34_008534 [Plutella xylostella]|uniref:Cuticular protein n=1 Tax=Plutella xylostella TaxID=51655 RepID=A0ABQ7QL57_PLUXY|nr:hypothetical protein JYU34_008534 [Plutella xylostella]
MLKVHEGQIHFRDHTHLSRGPVYKGYQGCRDNLESERPPPTVGIKATCARAAPPLHNMAAITRLTLLALACACATAQYEEERAPRYIASGPAKVAPTPVAILKQINRHNEDGSYTYGYEAGDGSFKIETKSPTGEVKGKYGYKDDTGKVRVIEYGANKYGFQPAGEGITVAPPTLVDETKEEDERQRQREQNQGQRTQYRAPAQQQQSIDYDYEEPAPTPAPRPAYRAPQPAYRAPQPAPQQPAYRAPAQTAPARPRPIVVPGAAPAPDQGPQQFFNPAPAAPAPRPAYRAPKQQEFSFDSFGDDFGQGFSQPAPQPQPQQPRYTQAPSQFQPQSQPFSMLDQLLKEYALPAGGAAPLHDITFGSY